MWNINIRRGRIWCVKSLNEYDYNYMGMTFGTSYVLILSAFLDKSTNLSKFTYLKVVRHQVPNRLYHPITVNDGTIMYVQIDELNTGDQRALESYMYNIDNEQTNIIVNLTKQYFNLKKQKEDSNYISIKKKPVKIDCRKNNTQIIHKFGIDITVTPNKYVSISQTGRLNLDKQVKDEIVYNTNTEEEFNLISEKYGISPIKAIHEIKNRLVYQYKKNK